MPVRRTYGCSECGHTWQFLHMTKGEAAQPCPNGCVAKPQAELSAPSIGRGAVQTGIAVPTTQSKREQLAADLALKHTGMGDVTANQKMGDIAAKSLPVPKDIPAGVPRESVMPRFLPPTPEGKINLSGAAGDPYKARNLGMIGSGRKLPRLQDASSRLYPGKR